MVFSSLIFLYGFLPLSLGVYALCRTQRARNASLLISSLVFYAWAGPGYVLILAFMALADWGCALGIRRAGTSSARKGCLALAVAVDLGLLGFFKYAGFFCSLFGPVPAGIAAVALPVGISFYTFQLITYVTDVYRGRAEAQTSYWRVLLYAALFHQCIAGPIVRYEGIAGELYGSRSSRGDLLPGIRRFTVGLAKKALLANPCGALADALLGGAIPSLRGLSVLGAWLGVGAFMLQIYLDFSAYSDMAIGLGRMLGLHYPENFNYPYIARSVTDFWRRWHMTLSRFFRDYLYIPLGGSRCSPARRVFNLLLVWILTGLWHGASWNFVLWGLYFVVLLAAERLFLGKLLEKLRVLPHIYLLLAVLIGWVLFYFTDLSGGWIVFRGLFGLNGNRLSDFYAVTALKNHLFLLAVSAVCATPALRTLSAGLDSAARRRGAAALTVWEVCRNCAVPVLLLLLSTCALVGDSYNPFIYFRF
ncbi:MAG: MBOAT family protein [Oscillospiraceae bacterium]|nr:MBOAT family protein [Oscillospiraceae bacterium]